MLASAGTRGDAARCTELGLDVYLTKPVTLSELRRAIQAGLSRARDEAPLVTRHHLRQTGGLNPDILLVEDNPVNQKLAVNILRKAGYGVDVAENGLVALDMVQRHPYRLVLMDMMMPVMDGLEATRRIRDAETERGAGRTPIVAMTANAMQGDRERCLAAGMDSYLSKPIKAEALQAEVERHLVTSPGADQKPEDIAALPVHDRAEALERLEDEELYASLLAMFIDDAPNYLKDMHAAYDAGDRKHLARAAHTIKGVLATFSAKRAELAARELEAAAQDAEPEQQARCMARVETEMNAFLTLITRQD